MTADTPTTVRLDEPFVISLIHFEHEATRDHVLADTRNLLADNRKLPTMLRQAEWPVDAVGYVEKIIARADTLYADGRPELAYALSFTLLLKMAFGWKPLPIRLHYDADTQDPHDALREIQDWFNPEQTLRGLEAQTAFARLPRLDG